MYRHDFLGWAVSIEVLDTHYVLVLIVITLNNDFFFHSHYCLLVTIVLSLKKKKKKALGFLCFNALLSLSINNFFQEGGFTKYCVFLMQRISVACTEVLEW